MLNIERAWMLWHWEIPRPATTGEDPIATLAPIEATVTAATGAPTPAGLVAVTSLVRYVGAV